MSARLEHRALADALVAPSVVLAGIAFLGARPFVAASPGARSWLFAASYAVLAVASVVVPAPAERPRLAPAAALALGLAAVAAAAIVPGAPVPVPWGAAAVPLGVVAAIAEEALFRRAAYGALIRLGAPTAIAASALLFALVHLPAYGVAAFPVDVGAGLLFGWQRWASGTWTVPAATHAAANLLAVLR